VPAYLPGEHPFQNEFSQRHGIPLVATEGGAQTMYPEFQKVVQAAPKPAPLPPPQKGAVRVLGGGQTAPSGGGPASGPTTPNAPQGGR
jgi:hypothetical protein